MSFVNLIANTAASNPIEEIFGTFGVHKALFIAQLINTILVLFLLKKFAFKPILAMLEERKNRIAEGEAKLQRIEKQLAETEQRTQAALEEANQKSNALIQEAKESAHTLAEQKKQEAILSSKQIIERAEAAAKQLRDTELNELRKEFGRLVVATTAQVTGKELNENDQARLRSEAMAKIEA